MTRQRPVCRMGGDERRAADQLTSTARCAPLPEALRRPMAEAAAALACAPRAGWGTSRRRTRHSLRLSTSWSWPPPHTAATQLSCCSAPCPKELETARRTASTRATCSCSPARRLESARSRARHQAESAARHGLGGRGANSETTQDRLPRDARVLRWLTRSRRRLRGANSETTQGRLQRDARVLRRLTRAACSLGCKLPVRKFSIFYVASGFEVSLGCHCL